MALSTIVQKLTVSSFTFPISTLRHHVRDSTFRAQLLAAMPTRTTAKLTQDWEPIVLSRRKFASGAAKDPKAVNQALRAGAAVETVKKFDAGTNRRAGAGPAVHARKLDESTEPAVLERVGADVRQEIQRARLAKKMSQAELAKRINERTQLVGDYESGRALPNQAVLAKMEKVLDVKLRGKRK